MKTFIVFLKDKLNVATLPHITFIDVLEILIFAVAVYYLINWAKKSRIRYLAKGIGILLATWFLAYLFELSAVLFIFKNAISVGIIAIFIIFQPELRNALEQLGQKKVRFWGDKSSAERFSDETKEEIIEAAMAMAKVKTGALIVIEQSVSLEEYIKTGIRLDSVISSALLINVFEHNTPLHDGAVIVRDGRAVAATCILPVSENMSLSKELGTRHRAGVGISEASDCLTIIVSEETGKIAIASRGMLTRDVTEELLRNRLTLAQNKAETVNKKSRKEAGKHGKKA